MRKVMVGAYVVARTINKAGWFRSSLFAEGNPTEQGTETESQ
jgi:hypothetical protein